MWFSLCRTHYRTDLGKSHLLCQDSEVMATALNATSAVPWRVCGYERTVGYQKQEQLARNQ